MSQVFTDEGGIKKSCATVSPPIQEIILSLKLVDYLLAQADKPWYNYTVACKVKINIVIYMSMYTQKIFKIDFYNTEKTSKAVFSRDAKATSENTTFDVKIEFTLKIKRKILFLLCFKIAIIQFIPMHSHLATQLEKKTLGKRWHNVIFWL